MTFDAAVVGTPFLDLTFEDLPRPPAPGEELVARALHVDPGGAGMQAIGMARLGLSVAIVARLGDDVGGRFVRRALEHEGVAVMGRPTSSTPTTALLSTPDGVAMASALSPDEPTAQDLAGVQASTFVVSLGRLRAVSGQARVVAVTGGLELPHAAEAFLASDRHVHALIVNSDEAAAITGSEPEAAARALSARAGTVVVTLGLEGALGMTGGEVVTVRPPATVAGDATGAGDLFIAAYVWADARDADVTDRLRWASLYSTLSVRAPTARAGAVPLHVVVEEGCRLGLTPP